MNPNNIKFETYNDKDALFVISEVYYPAGWRTYIDGKETKIYKTDHFVRSAFVPAGNHTIELILKPDAVFKYKTISAAFSFASLLILIIAIYFEFFRKNKVRSAEETNPTQI